MIIGAGEGHDGGGQRFSQRALEIGSLGMQHFLHACELGGLGGSAAGIVASNQHMHITADGGSCGQRLVGGILQ